MSSYEEDKDDNIKNYRPITFSFPESRARVGFEFKKDGKFIQYEIGPDDRPVEYEGIWIYGAKTKTIDITFKKIDVGVGILPITKEDKKPYTLEIITLEQNLFRFKKINQ